MEEGISISKKLWIRRIDFDESESALEIDVFMGSFKDLLNRLEVHCEAGCCGQTPLASGQQKLNRYLPNG